MSRRTIPGLEAPDPQLEASIIAKLDQVETALEASVGADSPLLAATARHLLVAGGKRFRPMLVLLAGHFGAAEDPRLITGSVAIELTHLATLYHDDVIDEADSRRGTPSANARWDNTVAILTGDYLFARASEISADLGTDVCRLLARTIAILCDGQIRELDNAGKVEQTEESYLETIRRKTGSLIATSCRLGGMMSDAPTEHLEILEAFGESLGLAFQLSDDIMDITSTAEELGKEPGVDMKEGVFTLPVLMALNQAEAAERDELADLLAKGAPAPGMVERALEIVRRSGAIESARSAVSDEVRRATEIAMKLPEGTARQALIQLSAFLALRCGAATTTG